MKFILFLLLCISAPFASLSGADPSRPNFGVFVADDMGWGDSATCGHQLIQSPNLDRLASRGVKFTQCYSAAAVCSPSRFAILTGRTPYRNGVWCHLSENHEAYLRASEITYPKLLKGIGYETCHVGKWHLNPVLQFNQPGHPQAGDHGYDDWMFTHNNARPSHESPDNFVGNGEPVGGLQGNSAQLVAAEAAPWLNAIHDPSKPFAPSVWAHEPHSPIATDPKWQSVILSSADFRSALGETPPAWTGLKELRLGAKETLRAGESRLDVGADWQGPVPEFRDLRWTLGGK